MDLLTQITDNMARSESYVEDVEGSAAQPNGGIRLLAYYLPQFHAIPENDAWWGKGFTEWTNVTKALPRFVGHYQPRLPGELGFYDLRTPDVLRRQAVLARRYGIEGFCFYYYWFGGKKLLETPLNMLLSQPDIDLPFCICWANGNWTRRWDGLDSEVLIAQRHSIKDDIEFARSLEVLFRDPRYIRINGRPLVMIYRAAILPDASATVSRWRDHFQKAGLGNPYIVMAQVYADDDPTIYGIDAAAGFPPHNVGFQGERVSRSSLQLFDSKYLGEVRDYEQMARFAASYHPENFKLFPGVCPSWDNEARRPGRGACFLGASPQSYGRWLEHACAYALQAKDKDERIVFVNAWNEWAEGAYLEPDRHYGYANLAETARVLNSVSFSDSESNPARMQSGQYKVRSTNESQESLAARLLRKSAHKVANAAENFAQLIRP
jgi:lipopolysaccharide biosynthesis protein